MISGTTDQDWLLTECSAQAEGERQRDGTAEKEEVKESADWVFSFKGQLKTYIFESAFA